MNNSIMHPKGLQTSSNPTLLVESAYTSMTQPKGQRMKRLACVHVSTPNRGGLDWLGTERSAQFWA